MNNAKRGTELADVDGEAGGESRALSLNEAATHLLDECRMVLPGIQALFGFQLVAVFNAGFFERLSSAERLAHLVAIGLVVIAIAFVMAPAALHRSTEPESLSRRFVHLSSWLLQCGMVPLG